MKPQKVDIRHSPGAAQQPKIGAALPIPCKAKEDLGCVWATLNYVLPLGVEAPALRFRGRTYDFSEGHETGTDKTSQAKRNVGML